MGLHSVGRELGGQQEPLHDRISRHQGQHRNGPDYSRVLMGVSLCHTQEAIREALVRTSRDRLNSLVHVRRDVRGGRFYVFIQVLTGHHKASSGTVGTEDESRCVARPIH